MLHKEDIHNSLLKIENAILKLDAGNERMFNLINQPKGASNFQKIVENISNFKGVKRIQTMFLRGSINGEIIDNTTEYEVSSWIEIISTIKPHEIMIYPIERETPAQDLERIAIDELNTIADKLKKFDIIVKVVG